MKSDEIAIALILAGIAAIVGAGIWYDHRHPCVRWEPSTCSECAVTTYFPDGDGNATIPVCTLWESVPCQVCAERAP